MPTLVDDLQAQADVRPDAVAVADAVEVLTYADLLRDARAVAAGLGARGVVPGDRVAVQLRNGAGLAAVVYGIFHAGAVAVPLAADAPSLAVAPVLQRCSPSVIVRAPGSAAGAVSPEELRASRGPVPPRADTGQGAAAIIHTSGSTGDARGAAFTHAAMSFTAEAVRRYLGTTAADRTLCVLPLSHTYGLYQLLVSVRAGGSLQLRHGFALPGDLPAQLAASGTTVLPGVPSLWARLLAMPDFTEERLPTLAVLTNAGAALPVSCVQALRSRFPRARLFLMYGQTECGRALYLDPSLVDSHPAAAGGALPGTCTWLEQSDGSPVPLGSVGELFVSGPHLMSGYWEQPEQTSEKVVHRRGTRALRTGDLFTEDSDGLLHFVGRVDDVFEVGGERVAPLEVEHVLSAAPGVRDVAVLARPDGLTGRRVVAVVVPAQEDALDPVVLRRWCAERLAPAKVPREVLVTDALPRLPNGKLDRCSLLASLATPSVGAPPARPAEMHSEGR